VIDMCKRGDIYYADLGEFCGSYQNGVRPVVIVSNDVANLYSPMVTIVPLTTQIKKRGQPTHVLLEYNDATGLSRPSMVLCEQVRPLNKSDLRNWVGRVVRTEAMDRITHALQVQIGAVDSRTA